LHADNTVVCGAIYAVIVTHIKLDLLLVLGAEIILVLIVYILKGAGT
jgi:hypothetical protein